MFDSEENDKQKELFNDYGQLSKKPRKGGFNLAKVYLSFSYENIFIVGIGLIMLLIVCYSLGVERGKQLAQLKSENIEVIEKKVQQRPQIESPQPPKEQRVRVKFAQALSVPAKTLPYIQVATFSTDKYAAKEMERLKNKGYEAFASKQGRYSVVYVGGYKSKDEANQALKELRKLYADCILRNK